MLPPPAVLQQAPGGIQLGIVLHGSGLGASTRCAANGQGQAAERGALRLPIQKYIMPTQQDATLGVHEPKTSAHRHSCATPHLLDLGW